MLNDRSADAVVGEAKMNRRSAAVECEDGPDRCARVRALHGSALSRRPSHAPRAAGLCAPASGPRVSISARSSSTEACALALLARSFDSLQRVLNRTQNEATVTPRPRLKRHLHAITDKLARDRW